MGVCSVELSVQIKATITVVQTQILCATCPFLLIHSHRDFCINAKTLADRLLGGNADDTLDACIISRAWIIDHFDFLYLVGLQTLQFHLVAHLPTVDVYLWRTSSKHFYLAVTC